MKRYFAALVTLAFSLHCFAHEGMWMLNNLKKPLIQQMQTLGLQLDQQQLYNPFGPSLKDAVVSFGGFCTGVVVSADGLVFTNHHCGFDIIQQHSSPKNDYLKEGFIAKSRDEELPNPELFVSFLLRTIDVSSRVLSAIPQGVNEERREVVIDSVCTVIQNEAIDGDPSLNAIVSPYFQGNEYYLSIYRDFKDVRLVFAPPSSVGKFGGDTDNWEWPRHTGDFSVFRIYANAHNEPAEYGEDNVPYHPTTYAPVSLQGYQEGSYSMTIGFPGETIRYLSSYGVEERMMGMNEAMIQVRGIKQEIWRKAMDANSTIRIMYDAKYAASSNYWKNSLGMNESIAKLRILEQKRELEKNLTDWIAKDMIKRGKYVNVIPNLAKGYAERSKVNKLFYFLIENFINSSDVLQTAAVLLRTDFSEDNPDASKVLTEVLEGYKNIDLDL
ncbi:MAG: S46 family peptidase, partial [Bacteroidaceae bacterium]|nr:S46 family peptidase [Bacteroidaceae bacterium]